jgi:hypothetical protein
MMEYPNCLSSALEALQGTCVANVKEQALLPVRTARKLAQWKWEALASLRIRNLFAWI